MIDKPKSRVDFTKEKADRHMRECVRAYRLHKDGLTLSTIAAVLGLDEQSVGLMIKDGRRFES